MSLTQWYEAAQLCPVSFLPPFPSPLSRTVRIRNSSFACQLKFCLHYGIYYIIQANKTHRTAKSKICSRDQLCPTHPTPSSYPTSLFYFAPSYFFEFNLFLSVYVFCLHVNLCITYMPGAWRGQKKMLGLIGLDTESCKMPCRCWELSLGPLEA